ncbi:MAG: hypothetical protein H7233_06255, partial [Pseudorhodobacter sp.]|nr:hypothetical protein [Frankiaceae bacterium]
MFEEMPPAVPDWARAAAQPVPVGMPAHLSTPMVLLTNTGQTSVPMELGMDA